MCDVINLNNSDVDYNHPMTLKSSLELGHKSLITGPVLDNLTCSYSSTVIQPNNTFHPFESWCQLFKVYGSDFTH